MAKLETVWVTVSGAVGPSFRKRDGAMEWLHGERLKQQVNAQRAANRLETLDGDDWRIGPVVEKEDSAHFEVGRFLQPAAIKRTRVI